MGSSLRAIPSEAGGQAGRQRGCFLCSWGTYTLSYLKEQHLHLLASSRCRCGPKDANTHVPCEKPWGRGRKRKQMEEPVSGADLRPGLRVAGGDERCTGREASASTALCRTWTQPERWDQKNHFCPNHMTEKCDSGRVWRWRGKKERRDSLEALSLWPKKKEVTGAGVGGSG